MAANDYEPYLSFDINDENTVKYLKCETLDVDTNTEGIHLVGTNEFPLGWAKIKKGRLKNKYSSAGDGYNGKENQIRQIFCVTV